MEQILLEYDFPKETVTAIIMSDKDMMVWFLLLMAYQPL